MQSRLLTGAEVVCYVNGQMLGRVADVSWDPSTPHGETYAVDTLEPVELPPHGVSCTGSMTIFRLHQDGGAEVAGLSARWSELTRGKYWSLLIIDRLTDTVVARFDRCRTSDQGWSARRGHVMGTIRFSTLDFDGGAGA